MCGIAGILELGKANGRSEREGHVARWIAGDVASAMTASVRHRGPDDEGVATYQLENQGKLAFGHTRLSILDLSAAGHQPMVDRRTGNAITFNGEIYNYKELRQALGDSAGEWQSQSDTEVILRAYNRWGESCLERLQGMFAFAIWDSQRQKLFLARDRVGIKPLYYYVGDGFFLFASEVRTILASGMVPPRLDILALWQYLAYQSVPAPRTMVEGIFMLLPGMSLVVDANGDIREQCYWHLLGNASPEAQSATVSEGRRRVGELLREAVSLHLASDVPVGAFLSGGIDSSAIVALMRELGQTPQTFTVTFTESAYTEASHARNVASRIGATHTEILLTEEDLLAQLPEAMALMDQPTGDGINTYVVSRAVRYQGIKVALSGLGGDELFGGYPSFARLKRASKYLNVWGHMPALFRSLTAKTFKQLAGSSVVASKAAIILEGNGNIASAYLPLRQVLSLLQRRSLLRTSCLSLVEASRDPYDTLFENDLARFRGLGTLSQISYAEGRTYMHDVLLRDTDQMSMAHALEVRVPLLDHKLVEYVMGLPDPHKASNGTPKRLLVESLEGLLPKEIVGRSKQGFTLPFDLWMRGSLRELCEQKLNFGRIADRGIMRPEQVQALWRDFLCGSKNVSWSRLWTLIVLEDWLERNGVTCPN